jgi:ribosome-associated toxin RatA of RatAB toxin-antitoxin module
MSRVERSALVPVSAEAMFELVNDVEAYPRRFSWCDGARVVEQGEHELLAHMQLRMSGLAISFTTRNRYVPGRSISLALVEGPFRRLAGEWQFTPLAECASKVALRLEFDLAGKLVGSALATGFRGLADRLVDDFVRQSRRVDGG